MLNKHKLSLAKAFYFFFYAAGASLTPFLAIYYQSLGFRGSQIGILASISPLMMLISTPIWGAIADITNKHKLSLLLAIAGAVLLANILSIVNGYILILFIVVVFAFFAAPIIPLVDNSVLTMLGSRRDIYGKQRMWGAVGWGISAPLIGILADQFGLMWIFWGYTIWLSLGFLVVFGIPIKPVKNRIPFIEGLRRMGSNKDWIFFLVTVFVAGVNLSIITNYLFLYLRDLGASRILMGWGLSLATVSEIPILFFADRLIKRFTAHGVLILSLVVSIFRAFGYSISPTPWTALSLQLLHGLTFSAMWAAGVTYAGEIAPPGMGATAQSVFFSIVFGLSGISGGLIGGFLFEVYGGPGMFAWSGTGLLVAAIGFTIFWKINSYRKSKLEIKNYISRDK